jgi:uncharacterized protein YbaP (TraB family)
MISMTRRDVGRFAAGLVLATAAGRALAANARGPPFWRVRQGAAEVTLLGFGDARDMSWYSPALRDAFARSDELWLETAPPAAQAPPDFARVARFSNLEGRTLFEVLDSPLVPRVRQTLAEYGIAESRVAGLRPWRVYYTLNGAYWQKHPPADEQKPVDAALAALAKEAGKLASYEFAGFADLAEFMGSMPDKAQSQYVEWLLDYLAERERGETDSYGWIEARRPERALERMAALPELYAEMQDKRNRWWAGTIRERLAAGRSAFVGVGQLHVMGPAGIPAQLERLGLEPVVAS